MFDRFTDRSRKSMGLAREAALEWNHDYIGTEHILLGILGEGSGVASDVLKLFDVDPRIVRARISQRVERGEKPVTQGQLPFTPRAKVVLEQALAEAGRLGHNYIGTEHLLLGLIQEKEGIAGQVLAELEVDVDEVRNEILDLLGVDPDRPAPATPTDRLDSLVAELERLKSRVDELERRLDEGRDQSV